jgi:hypothetical protein
VFSLSALAKIKWSNKLDLVGLILLAIASYVVLGAHIPEYFDFYSSNDFLLLMLIAAGDAFWIIIFTRFFIRGIELLPGKTK